MRTADRLFDGLTGVYTRLAGLTPLPTGAVTPRVFALRTGTSNFYVYKKGLDAVAIDAGFGLGAARRALNALRLGPGDVRALFLTHSDFDHVGALPLFPAAALYLSAGEVPMVRREISRKYGLFFNRPIRRAYTPLEDGEALDVGGIRVLAVGTPGHTPGSMSYLLDGAYLFVGDAFRLVDGKVRPIGPPFSMDRREQENSIRKLARLRGVEYAFTGHRGYTDRFAEAIAAFAGEPFQD